MRNVIVVSVLPFLLAACSAKEGMRRPAEAPRIEVLHCRLAPSGEFVDVQYRIRGEERAADPADTYLVDEATGEKYYLMLLQRIGRLPEPRTREDAAARSVMFRNFDRKLKAGGRVTLVVGGLRREHILLEK